MADAEQVVGQLPKASPDEDLVAKQSPKSEKTDARQKREHPSNDPPTEDLVDRSVPEPDQEREAMARRPRQLKKERKRERKKEMEQKKELKTLEERVTELRKQRENLEIELEESRQQLKRQEKLTAKIPKALRPELEQAREQPANAEVRKKQLEEETELGRRVEVEGPGTKLALEPGLGPKRGPVTHSVGPNGRKKSVLDTCKKKRTPSNVKSTNIDNFQIAINNLKEILLTAMADQNGIDSLPSAAADSTKHVAADFNAADKHDTSATENSTDNGEWTPSHSTGETTFEPGDLHSSPKVAESTPNDDGGDAGVTSPTGTARLPKQLRRLQSILDRLGRNEQERYIDTVLEDYQALRKQHEEFFSGNFNAPRFIEALRQTQTELGPFVCRMSQGYAYLHLWQ